MKYILGMEAQDSRSPIYKVVYRYTRAASFPKPLNNVKELI